MLLTPALMLLGGEDESKQRGNRDRDISHRDSIVHRFDDKSVKSVVRLQPLRPLRVIPEVHHRNFRGSALGLINGVLGMIGGKPCIRLSNGRS
jgi:hypothetical protein